MITEDELHRTIEDLVRKQISIDEKEFPCLQIDWSPDYNELARALLKNYTMVRRGQVINVPPGEYVLSREDSEWTGKPYIGDTM